MREGGGGGDCVVDKPAEMKACNEGPCVPITIWYSSPWTQVGWLELSSGSCINIFFHCDFDSHIIIWLCKLTM